jgi:hypothetical protein
MSENRHFGCTQADFDSTSLYYDGIVLEMIKPIHTGGSYRKIGPAGIMEGRPSGHT